MNFPTIHTNFWDAVIALPAVMILTQLIKIFFRVPSRYVPTVAIALGLIISIFISHPHHIVAGLFMGWFYGYAAIGNYAGLRTTVLAFRKKHNAPPSKQSQ
ncbi:hypothetical protein [Bacillus massiliglaciei]|uniref:hypothetical protein n=1 Tax=Bacillus massiliglaciei TaxID=1816693 RepID=UPI000DA5FFF2|nr:hypothetical protein [Bacillus massiliglaciei]